MKFFILLTTLILLGATGQAHTGPGSDGGDKAIVCRSSKGKITRAETLDLFEARNLYNLKVSPIKKSATVDEIVSAVEKKLEHSVENSEVELFPEINKVRILMHLVKPEAVLNDVDDAGAVGAPNKLGKNCKREQLANYTSEQDLFVNEEIWKKLDNKNKAALILHEGIYKYERYYGAKDSRRSRKVVAYAMSPFSFEDIHAQIPETAQLCESDKERFYLWSTGAWTQVQYVRKNGVNVYSLTRAPLPMALPWPPNLPGCVDPKDLCGFTSTTLIHSTFDNWDQIAFGTMEIDGIKSLVSIDARLPIKCRKWK
jgi:hypothetical protein